MSSTGIVRNVDELGRVVLPKETRKMLYIEQGDPLEIFYDEKSIYLKKYNPGCTFCNNVGNVGVFKGVHICDECKAEIASLRD